MVSILHPENACSLYQTTGVEVAAPVSKPLTTKNGIRQMKNAITN